VAEKLIPGIPIQTRIALLQQTSTSGPAAEGAGESGESSQGSLSSGQLSVLETVIDRATSRNEIQHEIDGKWNNSTSGKR
jgi:hypothetical protein